MTGGPRSTGESGRGDRAWPAAAAALLVLGCVLWGTLLNARHAPLELAAPPFVGHWDLRLGPRVLLPLAVALAAWWSAPRCAALPWRRLLLATYAAALAWAVSLALVDGSSGLRRPLTLRDDVLHDVGRVHDVTGLLGGFTSFINTYGGPGAWTTHVAGHPPGLLLLLAGLAAVGLSGPWPAAVLCVLAGAAAVPAALLTVRAVVDERTARAAAPFVAFAPAAIWVAVSDDALYLGVTTWGVALLALAGSRRSDLLAAAGGLLLGAALFLTYGVLPLGLLAVAVARRLRPLLVAGAAVLAVAALFALGGFWWPTGLHETLVRVHAGAGGYRPRSYFLVADVAALAVAVGPAVAAGLRALSRPDRLWLLAGPTLLALLVADLSGSSRGEVERIWLPFTPWLLVTAARLRRPRPWLAAQLVTGLVVQVSLRSKW